MTTRAVAILAFDDMEVLDFAGPYEVFNVAGELAGSRAFEVVTVGLTSAPAVGRGGFTVVPDHDLATLGHVDVLIVPGGRGTRPLMGEETLLAWLRDRAGSAELTLSVCTGALLLASAGLLAGLPATTHHDAFGELAAASPTTLVAEGRRFVRSSDRIRTSAGVSAGVDLALAVVEELAGRELRDAVVAEMEWQWPDRGPESATA